MSDLVSEAGNEDLPFEGILVRSSLNESIIGIQGIMRHLTELSSYFLFKFRYVVFHL